MGNLRELRVPTNPGRAVAVGFGEFQEVARVTHSVVRAYNRHLWRKLLERWIERRSIAGDWRVDKGLFSKLFNLFKSKLDNLGPINAYQSYVKLRPTVVQAIAGRPAQ